MMARDQWWAVYDLDGGEGRWAGVLPLFVGGPTASIELWVLPAWEFIPVRTFHEG